MCCRIFWELTYFSPIFIPAQCCVVRNICLWRVELGYLETTGCTTIMLLWHSGMWWPFGSMVTFSNGVQSMLMTFFLLYYISNWSYCLWSRTLPGLAEN